MTGAKFTSVDDYITTFPEEVQEKLQTTRETIRKVIPDAVEAISYGIPVFKLNDKYVVYLSAWKHHLSLYPIPDDPKLQKELEPYEAGKGTLRFPFDQPVPQSLVKKVVSALAKENGERSSY